MAIIFSTACGLSVLIGLLVLWANPKRLANQGFFAGATLIAIWFILASQTNKANIDYATGLDPASFIFHRANAAVACFYVLILWLIAYVIVNPDRANRIFTIRTLPIFAYYLSVSLLAFHPTFISENPNRGFYQRGIAYYLYSLLLIGSTLLLCAISLWKSQSLRGVRRLELQFLAVNLTAAAALTITFHTVSGLLQIKGLGRFGPIIILVSYGVCALGLAYHRIFNVKEVFTILTRYAASTLFLVSLIYLSAFHFLLHNDSQIGFIGCAVTISVSTLYLHKVAGRFLGIDGTTRIASLRTTAIALGRNEPFPHQLVDQFSALLKESWGAAKATLLFDEADLVRGDPIILKKNHPAYLAIARLGWATPETILRRPASEELNDLHLFLSENDIGAVVAVPRGSSNPSLLVALGPKTNGWPITYPEIERLQAIAELMDNILARSRLVEQAALQAKIEHLAMLSRGLAHDLKNLITPVSSFLIHTEGTHPKDSVAAEVHQAARRSVRIMTDYVREALFFSEQLAPKFEQSDCVRVCDAAFEVVESRARLRGVILRLDGIHPHPIRADTVLLQRMLANLVANAIDASPSGKTVRLSATVPRADWIQFTVADEGCGIAPDHLARIFEPYFTTKELGDDVRGFGLGLTVAQKIASLHRGTISVQSQLGQGTTMIVELPATQPDVVPAGAPAITRRRESVLG